MKKDFCSDCAYKCGAYRYTDVPDFEILLFSYAFDDEQVVTIDLASGEQLPDDAIAALNDPTVIKAAYNAQFERVCLSRHLGHWLDPHQWRCTAVMASYLIPSSWNIYRSYQEQKDSDEQHNGRQGCISG